MAGIIQGADLGDGLVFEIQLHALNSHLASPWEHSGKRKLIEKYQTLEALVPASLHFSRATLKATNPRARTGQCALKLDQMFEIMNWILLGKFHVYLTLTWIF